MDFDDIAERADDLRTERKLGETTAFVPALRVRCPNCQAAPGERCTAPNDKGRHEIKSVHYARVDAASDLARDLWEERGRDYNDDGHL